MLAVVMPCHIESVGCCQYFFVFVACVCCLCSDQCCRQCTLLIPIQQCGQSTTSLMQCHTDLVCCCLYFIPVACAITDTTNNAHHYAKPAIQKSARSKHSHTELVVGFFLFACAAADLSWACNHCSDMQC